MAKWIVYLWPVPQADDSSEQPYLQLIRSPIKDDTREQMIERITAIAYNGEYTIEDDGEPEPVIPPTNAELASILASVQSASAVAFVALCEVGTLDTVTASEHAELFAEWAYPVAYTVGQLRRHNGKLYKCVQAHTSQADWTPDTAVSLWSVAADPAEEWPAWSQPVGAHDAYAAGAKVSHNGKHWTSDVDNNVWEPGTAGTENLWIEVN